LRKPLERILYVEDEADIRTVAKMALETVGGFSVFACAGGREALAAAPAAGADLMLLDIMMPGMDGPTTLVALRNIAATAATPVIFMTAKVQAAEIAQYKALGALDVIAHARLQRISPATVSREAPARSRPPRRGTRARRRGSAPRGRPRAPVARPRTSRRRGTGPAAAAHLADSWCELSNARWASFGHFPRQARDAAPDIDPYKEDNV
jgi:two-component system OmpR family response regulator